MLIFSIVIATYNRRRLLEQCLTALFQQTFPHEQYEIIVVDDSSTDGTIAYLQELIQTAPATLRYLQQSHQGPAKARNLGIQHTLGQIIAMTDDDCVPAFDWLEKIQQGFIEHPEVVGVTGFQEAPTLILATNLIAQYERFQTREIYKAKDEPMVGGWEVPAGVTNNVAYRKDVLDKIGGFDENFPVPAGEDADLKKRITDRGYKILYLPIKVEHHQEYSLKRFLNQQYLRGIGNHYFQAKWQKNNRARWSVIMMLVKSIPRFFKTWLKSRSLRLAGLESLGRIWMLTGELKTAFIQKEVHVE